MRFAKLKKVPLGGKMEYIKQCKGQDISPKNFKPGYYWVLLGIAQIGRLLYPNPL